MTLGGAIVRVSSVAILLTSILLPVRLLPPSLEARPVEISKVGPRGFGYQLRARSEPHKPGSHHLVDFLEKRDRQAYRSMGSLHLSHRAGMCLLLCECVCMHYR